MVGREVDDLNRQVNAFLSDGASDSAFRLLSDSVPSLVRSLYVPDSNVKFLVHYTSLDVLFSLLKCAVDSSYYFLLSSDTSSSEFGDQPGFLRLYDTYHSNDPNEGQLLADLSCSPHQFTVRHAALRQLLEDRSKLPAYIASFRGVCDLEQADDLVFWRTYGNEGKGCAIVFPISFIKDAAPVLQVKYGPESKKATLDHLSIVFDGLPSAVSIQGDASNLSAEEVPKYVSSALSPIPYLHKYDEYRFEEEVRVVVPYKDLYPNTLYGHQIADSTSGTKIRHFAHLPMLNIMNLFRTDSFLYLGPAVSAKKNLAFVLERRLHHFGLVGTKIRASQIGYRS